MKKLILLLLMTFVAAEFSHAAKITSDTLKLGKPGSTNDKELQFRDGATIKYNVGGSKVDISDDLDVTGSASISSELSVLGDLSLSGILNALDDIVATGSITSSGNASITGDLDVGGDASASNMTATGSLTANDGVEIGDQTNSDIFMVFKVDTASTAAIKYDSSSGFLQFAHNGQNFNTIGTSAGQRCILKDVKSNGTVGGTPSAATWNTRDLNTTEGQDCSFLSLSSNQVTLDAGSYYVKGSTTCFLCDRNKPRLRNITDSTDEIIGESAFADGVANRTQSSGRLEGYITISASKTVELQHYVTSAAGGTNGLGVAVSAGVSEVYSIIEFFKVE